MEVKIKINVCFFKKFLLFLKNHKTYDNFPEKKKFQKPSQHKMVYVKLAPIGRDKDTFLSAMSCNTMILPRLKRLTILTDS